MSSRGERRLTWILLIAVAYFGAAKLGFRMAVVAEQVTLVWPPTGIALAAVLLLGPRIWPGIALGAFAANLTTGHPGVAASLAIAGGNTSEALLGAWLLRRFLQFDPALPRVRDVIGWLAFAVLGCTLVGATVGATTLCAAKIDEWPRWTTLWREWWIGDAMGAAIVAPFLMTWARRSRERVRLVAAFEACALLASLVCVSWLVYGEANANMSHAHPLEYLAFPFLIWAAMRLGQAGTTAVTLVVAAIAISGTIHGFGPFGRDPITERLVMLQLFLLVMSITGLTLGAAVHERRRAEARLRADFRVSQELAESESLVAAAPRILRAICETLHWDLGAVWRVDQEAGALRCVALWHGESMAAPAFATDTHERTFARGVGLPGRVWSSSAPAWIADVVHDTNFPRAPIAAREGLHSAFGFPLSAGDGVIGVIEFFSAEIRQPDAALLEMMGAVGGRIGQYLERENVETKLRENERELTDFFDNAALGLHWVGPDGVIERVNQMELDMLGYSRDEYVGHSISEFYADPELNADILRRLHLGEELHNVEVRLRCKDGSIKHALVDSNVLWDKGRFVHTRCFTRDISDRKRAEDAHARLAAIVESSADAIISKTLDGTITSWNRSAERLLGFTAAEAIGRPILLILPPERQAEETMILERVRSGERIDHLETVRMRKDGRRIDVALSISPVKNAAGRIVGVSKILRDISAQKRAEDSLRLADRRKDEFLATLAHELRNPLAPISNALQLLRIADDDRVVRGDVLEMADRQLQLLVRLVDDLLDVSRITRGKIQLRIERALLSDIVQRAVETSRPLIAQCEHALAVEIPDEPVWLDVDPMRIAQSLSNLLNNAAKYSERGRQIRLLASTETSGPDARRELVLRVRDEGLGISADTLPYVFDAFVQADRSLERSHGGLGIGLTVVKWVTEMHGGNVEAKSAGLGRGSEFIVRLPLPSPAVRGPSSSSPPHETSIADHAAGGGSHPVEQERATLEEAKSADRRRATDSAHTPPTPTSTDPSRPRRVLVVDDNAAHAESLTLVLRKMGNEVEMVTDALEAVDAVRRFAPDLVLLDIAMPKLNGYDAARQIRAEPTARSITLIALTGWGQEDDRRRSMEAGFDEHLVKPVQPSVLREIVARVVPRSANRTEPEANNGR